MNKYINIENIKTILQEVEAPDCSLIELLGALKEIATILEQPSADVAEVKHGEWVYQSGDYFTCTNCGDMMVRNVYPFCPWCGADMRERKETE